MAAAGTPPTVFARRVLALVGRIPAGRVVTYGDLARLAGRPGAARAVGSIMRQAAIPGLPYHRVIAAGGRLGGYGGHEGVKQALLRQEGLPVSGGRVRGFARYRWPPRAPAR
jgi:O-6-methylguanine DNA methyltransferase